MAKSGTKSGGKSGTKSGAKSGKNSTFYQKKIDAIQTFI